MTTIEQAIEVPIEVFKESLDLDNNHLVNLFNQAQQHNAIAAEELFAALLPYARQIAARTNSMDPEALAQDGILKLWTKGVQNEEFEPTNIKGWLQRVITNQVKDEYRHGQRLRMNSLEEMLGTDRPNTTQHPLLHAALARTAVVSAETSAEWRIEADEIHYELSDATVLDPRFKDVFILLMADKSYDEIAVILDIPIGTVRSRIFRARTALKDRYSQPSGQSDAEL